MTTVLENQQTQGDGEMRSPAVPQRRPRIAICDYTVKKSNPMGSCNLTMIEALCEEFDFTVFGVEFENPRPDRIRFVRVPVPLRPLVALFFAYHIALLPIFYWHKWVRGERFDAVQSSESCSLVGEICYAHFCHRAYLRDHYAASSASGMRGLLRWLDHRMRALGEPGIYTRARAIVVPSNGLFHELLAEYPNLSGKTTVISNPVDTASFARPADFSSATLRQELGFAPTDTVGAFVALGHFERKGLPFLLQAMVQMKQANLKLIVVGGRHDLVSAYQKKVEKLGLESSVRFVGVKQDVRPYLWASDFFAFPSLYEVFSLVTLQSAAAGLPLLAGRIHGVDELLVDGKNGILIECSTEGVQLGLEKYLGLDPAQRAAMSLSAVEIVQKFNIDAFVGKWRAFYVDYLKRAVRQDVAVPHKSSE